MGEIVSGSVHDAGNRLRSLRASRMLSKAAFAKKIGVSTVTVWKWERGASSPKIDRLDDMARALNISTKSLKKILMVDQDNQEVNGQTPLTSGKRLTNMVLDARREIALEAGVDISQVEISIAY
jgi:transcriptional regulator with XRE-family HTH domain